jgi:hypothetical protein
VRADDQHRSERELQEFLGDAAEQRCRTPTTVRRHHEHRVGLRLQPFGKGVRHALTGEDRRRRDPDAVGVVVLCALSHTTGRLGFLVLVEHDLDDLDRRVAAARETARGIGRSPRRVGSVNRDDEMLHHEDSLSGSCVESRAVEKGPRSSGTGHRREWRRYSSP